MAAHDRGGIIPALYYRDATAALGFLEAAFGFAVEVRVTDTGGRVQHAQMVLGEGRIRLGPPGWDDWVKSPSQVGGANTQSVHVAVPDAIAHCARARAAGAVIVAEPAEQFYGDFTYRARDPEGHVWTFFQPVRDVPIAEMEANSGLKITTR
ncbi:MULTISPECIES: VOC family protein [Nitrospirillum]|uniref:Putative glyoxalase superfamily protein PhnB n=1 Tax=Nitrospirillum amazonense TaxID=28077 RepID=A0A560FMW0_9PROT|nr:VOC family protein [Nitrospirillum amazonense]MEC4591665.1 VOC family protein [Nitrospirillum amazonense]TWB22946.1 putative glyoxalase superfamily protein PhnB [Nitrospirillum amazonense]